MDKFLIRGGRPLNGKIAISGAKNSALPCLAAALLTAETVTLHNVPYVKDLITQRRLLEDLGATVLTPELRTHKITAKNIEVFEAPCQFALARLHPFEGAREPVERRVRLVEPGQRRKAPEAAPDPHAVNPHPGRLLGQGPRWAAWRGLHRIGK